MQLKVPTTTKISITQVPRFMGVQEVNFFIDINDALRIEDLELVDDDASVMLSLSPQDSDIINRFLYAAYEGKQLNISSGERVVLMADDGASLCIQYTNFGDPYSEGLMFEYIDCEGNAVLSSVAESRNLYHNYVKDRVVVFEATHGVNVAK